MKYLVCPRCRNLTSRSSAFCLFCGKALQRGARRIPPESPASPRTALTKSAVLQRALGICALLLFLVVCALPWVNGWTQSACLPEAPSVIAAPGPDTSAGDSPFAAESPGNVFSTSSGQYPVILFVSEVTSDDPAAKSAADALSGERFDGTLTVAVDAEGSGTVSIDQAFFPPEEILVSAFQDESGNRSDNTLYGVAQQNGVKLSIVCVCADGGISGFIWMDNALTHIEFLYFS